MSLNRRMSDRHEADLVEWFGGRRTPGSGNGFANPCDGRNNRFRDRYSWAWDGKSTLGKTIGVGPVMWSKVVEQSFGDRPMLPLRYYRTERLEVGLDLIVVGKEDFLEILEVANGLED